MKNAELIARLKSSLSPNKLDEEIQEAFAALEAEVERLNGLFSKEHKLRGDERDEMNHLYNLVNDERNRLNKLWGDAQAQLAAAQGQKPFAWAYQCSADRSGPVFSKTKNNWADSGTGLWTETPLYAAPILQQPAEQAQPEPVRCQLCNYQHGHMIGCENNPVDIALKQQAQPEQLADRLFAAVIDLATPDGGDVSDIGAQPERAGLDKDTIAEIAHHMEAEDCDDSFWVEFTRAVEAHHGIKQGGPHD